MQCPVCASSGKISHTKYVGWRDRRLRPLRRVSDCRRRILRVHDAKAGKAHRGADGSEARISRGLADHQQQLYQHKLSRQIEMQ